MQYFRKLALKRGINMDRQRIIVAITGATGAIYGIRLLEALRGCSGFEVHLVLSNWAEKTIALETGYTVQEVISLADCQHDLNDVGASIASGSFKTAGMVIIPCSMKTLAGIAHGFAGNLIIRAADVMLKERKKLILVPRETPLSVIHLENMLTVTRAGGCLIPPMPAFYNHPASIDDLVNHLVGRVMDQLGIPNDLVRRWGELAAARQATNKKIKQYV